MTAGVDYEKNHLSSDNHPQPVLQGGVQIEPDIPDTSLKAETGLSNTETDLCLEVPSTFSSTDGTR